MAENSFTEILPAGSWLLPVPAGGPADCLILLLFKI
jgi:hypothetical protein